MNKVRVRIAPSPTGEAHIGTAYTALFNFAFAKKNRGDFILRIEDTDRSRYAEEAEKIIFEGLNWLGLYFDEGPGKGGNFGPYRQSERQRVGIYKKYVEELIEKEAAYYCFCSSERLKELRERQRKEGQLPRYDGKCRSLDKNEAKKRVENGESHVVRLKIPKQGAVEFEDVIRGRISVENRNIDDQILLKSDGFPTYHLAVVVDDYLMRISHVIRAEEWLSSVPKHIVIYKALGWKEPVFCHLPLVRNKDRSKISKRKNPISILWYKKKGFLPEAVLNYLALLGWSHPEGKEVFPLNEFIDKFDLKRVQAVGPVFDLEKLTWLNGVYIRRKRDIDLYEDLKPFLLKDTDKKTALQIIPLVKERINLLSDWQKLTSLFFKKPEYDLAEFKKIGLSKEEANSFLSSLLEGKEITVSRAKEILKGKDRKEAKKYFKVLHFALSGKLATPPLDESMEILGRKKVVKRIKDFQKVLCFG